MSVKIVARQQYRGTVDHAAADVTGLRTPPEGWLRTVRSALGMSGTDVAERLGVTRARVTQAEHAELRGAITLQSMQATAEAMGCRFVYAIVPVTGNIDDIVMAQARKLAIRTVRTASQHMALEGRSLPDDQIAEDVERLTREIARDMPPDFWREK